MATILLHEPLPQAWFDALAAFLQERQPEDLPLSVAQAEDPEEKLKALREAEILLSGLAANPAPIGPGELQAAESLRLILRVGSRTTGIDLKAAGEASVSVSLVPSPHHIACAEHTILLILAVARKLVQAHRKTTARGPRTQSAAPCSPNWPGIEGIRLLVGKTLGLLGMGDVAIEVARRARPFGLAIIYHDTERLDEQEEQTLGVEYRDLDALMAEADILSLHLALSPRTEGIVNAERIAAMKQGAILINTARGGLVDEEALAQAISEGRIAGAGIDAWAEEPPPRTNPLLGLENVVATPHIASVAGAPTALFEAILPPILAALRDEPIPGLVTPDAQP